jgi:hypothetical protein
LVLSVIPHFNREIAESLQPVRPENVEAAHKNAFCHVTLITDLADYPPHFWIERESEYIIAGTDRARNRRWLSVFRRPYFPDLGNDPEAEVLREQPRRSRSGKKKARPGARLSDGHCALRRPWLAGDDRHHEKAQRIGQRRAVDSDLRAQPEARRPSSRSCRPGSQSPSIGFAQNVEYYMALADFFIGKPGPGSISEALQFHLPVIVERNSKTLPQERYNAEWVTERANVRRDLQSSNRALSEVPLILEQCAIRESRRF